MNWKDFQQKIYDLTIEDTQVLNTQIIGLYSQAQKDIASQIAAQYQRYLASVDTIDYYNELIKYNRLKGLLTDVKAAYVSYSAKAQSLIENVVKISASNAYYRSVYASSWLMDGLTTIPNLPYNMVELIVYGTADKWKKIPESIIARYGVLNKYIPKAGTLTEFILQNRANEVFKLQNAITSGLRQGLPYEKMTDSVAGVIGSVNYADGYVSADGAVASAMRIIRTEGTRAMNAASYCASKDVESEGHEIKKQWQCTLDKRTRDTHAQLDGVTIDLDDKFQIGDDTAMFPGEFSDPANVCNCRCTCIDIINGNSPDVRIGRNPDTDENETFSYTDFSSWAKDNGLTQNIYGEYYSN